MSEPPRFQLGAAERSLLERAEAIAAAWAKPSRYPFSRSELLAIFAELRPTGYLGSVLPSSGPTPDLTPLEFAALAEGLSPALPLLGNHSVQRYLHSFGTEEQKRVFLPDLLAGRRIAGIAITEPQAGGDLNAIRTTARRQGDRYILDGVKTWVTHGLVADLFIVLAKTGEGLSRFIVPGEAPGIERTALSAIGLKHLTFAELRFEGCEIGADLRLGAEGAGAAGAKSAFPIARALAALQAARLGDAALALGADFVRERVLFGRRLSDSALIQHDLAEIAGRLAGARLLAHRCMADLDGSGSVALASGAKAQGCEAALAACRWTMDVLGSTGLLDETAGPLERLHQDARMMAVVDGTTVLNRFVAARRIVRRATG